MILKHNTDVYHKLARHLDGLPGGFPPTESGVELRILQRLFTPEQAGLAVHLTPIPEPARVLARRAGLSVATTKSLLEEMSRRGLIMSLELRSGWPRQYLAAQFVIGIWEFNVNNLDQEFVRDMHDYMPSLFNPEAWGKSPQIRTIPISRSLPLDHSILPYDRAEEIIRAQKRFLVAPCICRREQAMVGLGCQRPEESCLVFGLAADYYLHLGVGRSIDRSETLDILCRGEEQALVLQPGNTRAPLNICLCCGCCCGVLRNVKQQPRPADLTGSGYLARLDRSACLGCGLCLQRCQMDALSLDGPSAVLNPDRCIGCGLCVSTCPAKALTLVPKPDHRRPPVPRDSVRAALQLGRATGSFGPRDLGLVLLRSLRDRLLSLGKS